MFRKLKRKTRKLLMAAVKPFPRARRLSRAAIRARRVRLYEKLAAESETDEKLIIFESFHGRNYSDNPRAIFEKMCEMPEFNGYKFVWAFKKVAKFNRYDFPEIAEMRRHSALENSNVEIVEYGSRRYREVYASAGVWVSNSRIPDYIYRKDDQKYIQTWHGTPLKRLGYDIKSGNNALNTMRDMREKYDSDAMRYTAMVSPSPYVSEIYKSAFNLDNWHRNNIVYETGYPRNDLLVNFSEDDVLRIKQNLGITEDKKVILYAPTWRDNQHKSGVGYTFKNPLDFDKLKADLGEDYVILYRSHYFVGNNSGLRDDNFVIDVSKYPDIAELYIASDMLITDYSSVFFDYAILKRPIIFFMYDLAIYRDELRGFYISLDELPGKIIEEQSELAGEIQAAEINKKQFTEFNKKFNPYEDGESARRVIGNILKEMKK